MAHNKNMESLMRNPFIRFFLSIFFVLPEQPEKALPEADPQTERRTASAEKNAAIRKSCTTILSKLKDFEQISRGTCYEHKFQHVLAITNELYGEVNRRTPDDLTKLHTFNRYYAANFISLYEGVLDELRGYRETKKQAIRDAHDTAIATRKAEELERRQRREAEELEILTRMEAEEQETRQRRLQEIRDKMHEEVRRRAKERKATKRMADVRRTGDVTQIRANDVVYIVDHTVRYAHNGVRYSVGSKSDESTKSMFRHVVAKTYKLVLDDYIGNTATLPPCPVFESAGKYLMMVYDGGGNVVRFVDVKLSNAIDVSESNAR